MDKYYITGLDEEGKNVSYCFGCAVFTVIHDADVPMMGLMPSLHSNRRDMTIQACCKTEREIHCCVCGNKVS